MTVPTAKLQQLITTHITTCRDLHAELGANSGWDEDHPLWVAMKESQRAMNNEIAALNIEMIRLKMRNTDLQGFVEEYVSAWTDGMAGDSYMFSAASKLSTTNGDIHE